MLAASEPHIATTCLSEETKIGETGWENLSPEHLERDIVSLKKSFPRIDGEALERILKKNGGHIGKATKEIFKTFEGVEEQFYKKYPGAFGDKQEITFSDGGTGLVYGWDLRFDPCFVSNPRTINSGGVELQEVSCSIMILGKDKKIHYPNDDYFYDLADKGESTDCEGEWGTDPNDVYDENHPSNPKKLVPTRRELEANLINWKVPLLGKIPFIDTDNGGKRGIYQGINIRNQNQKKRKLPKGWYRMGGKEYNGLYYYHQKDKVPQWKHPLDCPCDL